MPVHGASGSLQPAGLKQQIKLSLSSNASVRQHARAGPGVAAGTCMWRCQSCGDCAKMPAPVTLTCAADSKQCCPSRRRRWRVPRSAWQRWWPRRRSCRRCGARAQTHGACTGARGRAPPPSPCRALGRCRAAGSSRCWLPLCRPPPRLACRRRCLLGWFLCTNGLQAVKCN